MNMSVPVKEVGFGTDNFDEPKVLDVQESIGRVLYRIFVMKPGTLPSLPNIGVDISRYLYKREEDISYEELRTKIFASCSSLLTFMTVGDILIKALELKGVLTLIVAVNVVIDGEEFALVSALNKGEDNDVAYSFRAESLKLAS